jgi:2-hydroxycyclohexanecarboxyl-CoA dehydrogenase
VSRVAVVTGGASGIGRAICCHLADRGHRVGVLDLDAEGAHRTAEDLRNAGASAIARAVDVADRASVDHGLDRVRAELGPITIMVTSAGVAPFGAFTDTTFEMWERVIAVNLTGTFHCVQAAVPDMVSAGWGRVVTISSSAGQWGPPGLTAYAASKGGVIAFTRAVARELGASGITANTIPPFLVETPMSSAARDDGKLPSLVEVLPLIPVGRAGTPDDIAAACVFLCSDEAAYITGQVIAPNGGALM